MLGVTNWDNMSSVEQAAPLLRQAIADWLEGRGGTTFIIKAAVAAIDIQVSLSRLTLGNEIEILVFLDDVSRLRQQAQLLKLASLGRLTASIAHEVRNPLGAISHAGQLLSESGLLNDEERRLTTIINEQSVRVNSIIENVMRISRRERPVLATINLVQWMVRFIDELKSRYNMEDGDLRFVPSAETISANMDASQFYQVMWNICENGIRYIHKKPWLEIRCSVHPDTQRPYVDIVDQGNGIAADILEQLFEPFITTETRGTGLGLFIARELCEANQATLNLYYNTAEGCCFRINFSHPERKQVIY